MRSPRVEPRSSADASNSLTTAPHCHTHMFGKINLVISKPFFSAMTLFEAGGVVFIINSNIHLRKISLSAYVKAISHYFRFKGPIDVDKPSN